MRKSDTVRALIAQAKTEGLELPNNALIQLVQDNTGFKRQLARAYIINNWNKVEAFTVVAVEHVQEAVPASEPELVPVLTKEEKLAAKRARDAARKREARARAKLAALAV